MLIDEDKTEVIKCDCCKLACQLRRYVVIIAIIVLSKLFIKSSVATFLLENGGVMVRTFVEMCPGASKEGRVGSEEKGFLISTCILSRKYLKVKYYIICI